MNSRRASMLAILLAAIAMGAVRDFLFINLNYQIDFVGNQRAFSYAHSQFRGWVEGWDLSALLLLKWSLAIGMIAFTLLLCILLARLLFGDHRYRWPLVIGFGTVGALALLFHGMAGQLPALEGVSIKLLHLLQYPVVLFFIWAASWLRQRPAR